MKPGIYIKIFTAKHDAREWMRMKNQTTRSATHRDLFVVMDGPEDNFAVVDLPTAIEIGGGYEWEP